MRHYKLIKLNATKSTNDKVKMLIKSKKIRSFIPNNVELTVLVSVKIDNLKEFSNDKLSSAKILERTNIEIIKKRKIKKAIL